MIGLKIKKSMTLFTLLVVSSLLLTSVVFAAASGTHTPVEGVTVSVSGATDNSMSGGAVTVTAKGSGGIMGFGASAKTATITIYNDSTSTATVSFDWTATSVNELKIDGTPYTGTSGSFSKSMNADENFVITITTAKNSTTNKLVMKNFGIAEVAASSQVKFYYDSSLGSITEDGKAVNNDETKKITSAGTTLVATKKSGAKFLAWVDGEGKKLETAATFAFIPPGDMTVRAVFYSDSPSATAWFLAGGDHYFDDLNEAASYAATAGTKTVVLMNNATLPAGNYTIPSGVTLLIPNDMANTVYTTKPGSEKEYKTAPSIFRTLTMAKDSHIVVNGAISVAGMQSSEHNTYPPGTACGPLGYIDMKTGSKITVNSGANLYAWGYIIGSGTVDVYGTVYEDMQIGDWRGGDAGSTAAGNKKEIMPVSLFYIQNVQVPMTLYYGAQEQVSTAVSVTIVGLKQVNCDFLGSTGIIQLKDNTASLTKDYNEIDDRIEFTLNGNCSIGSIFMSIPTGVIGSVDIDSSKYYMTVGTTWDFALESNCSVTVNQSLAFLPGSTFNVKNGATATLADGVKLCVYDAEDWGQYVFKANPSADHKHLPSHLRDNTTHDHSDEVERDAMILINGTIDATKGEVYTTAGGANLCSTGGGKILMGSNGDTTVYQYHQMLDDGNYKTLEEIPIDAVSAKLKNANGTYAHTLTGKSTTNPNTFTYTNGKWVCAVHSDAEGTVNICDACGTALVAQIVGENKYASLAEAVSKCGTTSYIQMLADTDESVTITGTVNLDLNGHTIAEVTVSGTLNGMDTANNDFSSAPGSITKLSLNGGSVSDFYQYNLGNLTGKYYIACQNGESISFHRFDMGVKKYTFYKKGTEGALVFDLVFRGDNAAFNEIFQTGACITGDGQTQYTWTDKASEYSGYISLTEDDFSEAITVKAAVKLNENDLDTAAILGDRYFANGISLQALLDAMNNGGAG